MYSTSDIKAIEERLLQVVPLLREALKGCQDKGLKAWWVTTTISGIQSEVSSALAFLSEDADAEWVATYYEALQQRLQQLTHELEAL